MRDICESCFSPPCPSWGVNAGRQPWQQVLFSHTHTPSRLTGPALHFSQNTHLSHPGLFDLWDQFAGCLVTCSCTLLPPSGFWGWLSLACPVLRTGVPWAPAGHLDIGSHLLSDCSCWTSQAPHSSCRVLKGMPQASSSSPHLSTALEA